MRKIARIALFVGLAVLVIGSGCRRQTKGEDELETTFGTTEVPLFGEPPSIEDFVEAGEESVYEDIRFDYDRSFIRGDAIPTLKLIAEDMKKNSGRYLLVEGHCDERGTNEYNLALGEKRALSTREFLINLGVAAERVVTISYGEEEPLDPQHNDEAWAKNRRAHFRISE